MENKELELAMAAAKTLDEKKGTDIVIIDIRNKASFADYFVLASGSNERLVGNLAEEVEKKLLENGIRPKSIEGDKRSGWILMDYIDVIVNVLSVEARSKYSIETIWGDCEFITL
ncbi:MAG: ribosome silencing factor [Anaerovoracaceae bacterium]|nr:ribosome silencing factor [Clostridiales bacterium]